MLSRLIRNNTTEWDLDDTEELFEQNWKSPEKRELLIRNNYSPDTVIKYQIDNYGLRNKPNIDISKCVLALGDSYTYGSGLDVNDAWPAQFSQLMDVDVYNAGIPGGSMDTMFRLAKYLVGTYKPVAVILLSPPIYRYEFYTDKKFYNYKPEEGHGPVSVNGLYEISSELHNKLNAEKNLRAIHHICMDNDIIFIHKRLEDVEPSSDGYDFARDLAHAGRKTHLLAAEQFKKAMGWYF